jgi:hypothetical protein
MLPARRTKAVHRQAESAEAQARDEAVLQEGDRVLIASIDSFPASDPPGWIEGKARPCENVAEDGAPRRKR